MKRHIIAAAVTLFTIHVATAQEESGYNESVVVRGSYRPTIEQSEKLTFPAIITDTIDRIEHKFSYSIAPSRLKSVYEPTRIKAARVVGEPATKLYNNYFRLGFGNNWTPLADLYLCSTRDREKAYGISVNHLSSWGSIPDYGPMHQNNTQATVFGRYIIDKKLQLSADLGYEHDHNLYYGFTDSLLHARYTRLNTTSRSSMLSPDELTTSAYRASYNLAQANFALRNMELDPEKLGYSARLHAEDLWATYGRNEFGFAIGGDIHYGFDIANRYRAVAFLEAEWQHYADSRNQNEGYPYMYHNTQTAPLTDTIRHSRNIIRLSPYADFMIGGLQFRTGVKTTWDGFSTDTLRFHIYPDVTVCKKLLNDNLALSITATGGISANTWNTIRLENPYISPDAEQIASDHYDFIANARWTLSRKLEANIEAKYQIINNDLFFYIDNDYGLDNVFRTVYIDNNMLTLGGDITFVNDEMLTMRAGGHYYNCMLRDSTIGKETTYRPDWDALITAAFNLNNQWLFSVEGRLMGSMITEDHTELPMRYGIRAEVEYRHNRALSFFLRADNLAFQRYCFWQNYPSHLGLFILGLTYTL